VAAAGPVTNIIIALFFGLILRSDLISSAAAIYLMAYIVFINIVLALFNLMPVPPLDGSKIFYALIPQQYQQIRHFFESHSLIMILIFLVFLWQYITPLISIVFSLMVGIPLGAFFPIM
jgi:Zn-dependent protease